MEVGDKLPAAWMGTRVVSASGNALVTVVEGPIPQPWRQSGQRKKNAHSRSSRMVAEGCEV